MNQYKPLISDTPPARWVKGIPAYDVSFKLSKLISFLSKYLYNADYSEFNVFYAFINDDLKNTIARLTSGERALFDAEGKMFSPSKIVVKTPVYDTVPADYDELKSGPFIPSIIKYEDVETDDLDWTQYLFDTVVQAGGWVYTPYYLPVPFTENECAPYHYSKLNLALHGKPDIARNLVKALEL